VRNPFARWRWRPPLGLRFTLALSLVPLLVLPLIGLRFVEVMTELARDERLENLGLAARNLAASLHERPELFLAPDIAGQPDRVRLLAVGLLADVRLDQRDREWVGVPSRQLGDADAIGPTAPTVRARVSAARAQERPGKLFLLIDADDERLVLPEVRDGQRLPGDELVLLVGERVGALREIRVQPVERPGGWRAEIELDPEPSLLRIRIIDVDYLGSRQIEGQLDSGLLAPVRSNREGVSGDPRVPLWASMIRSLGRASGRVSVHDASGELLSQTGEPGVPEPPETGWQSRIARGLLAAADRLRGPADEAVRDPADAAQTGVARDAPALTRALGGVPAQSVTRLSPAPGLPAWLLTSAHPVWVGDRVVGALVIEENTASRLSLGQATIERLTLLTALAMAASVGALLLVASITVGRIVRLRRQAERAIDSRGRVVGRIRPGVIRDEIGALAVSHAQVLERLRQHQQYLGNLRSRLVHELRTPIMVVRSSLDNLAAETDDTQRAAYLERVREGAQRLERIVASMGEASSLESMLAQSELEQVELAGLLEACAGGYRSAFGIPVEVACAEGDTRCAVVPEAIAQALDKLVSNAADFATPGTPVRITLARTARQSSGWRITVANRGPSLPATMRDSLFDSMVSVRSAGSRGGSHLGLGLYLVRLVAEFHGGRAFARDADGGVEVGFTIRAGR
jgi:two-component system, OmpR family, sensor histidine kinase ChvG